MINLITVFFFLDIWFIGYNSWHKKLPLLLSHSGHFAILTEWLWLALIVSGWLLMTIPDSGGLTLTLKTLNGPENDKWIMINLISVFFSSVIWFKWYTNWHKKCPLLLRHLGHLLYLLGGSGLLSLALAGSWWPFLTMVGSPWLLWLWNALEMSY
jgi:hypothetical protein